MFWIEREDGSAVANLAVWYQQERGKPRKQEGKPAQGGGESGTKWLPDLRQWWRRSGRSQSMPIDGVTGADGFKVGCTGAPTQVLLGLGMFGVALQPIDVAGRAGADKTYVFEFDPGDLGRKRFAGQRLTLDSGNLVMIYADTPIRELSGRSFRYVRQ